MSFSVEFRNETLFMEEVELEEIAQKIGTPCYVYSYRAIKENFEAYQNAFRDLAELICYSVKANSNLAVLRAFHNLGSGFDIVSGGELKRVIRAGGDPSKVVFSGVGKTDEEISEALDAGILFFNVESEEELENINRIALEKAQKAPIAIRVNPDIDPKTHPYISTGFKKSKFGIEIDRAKDVYKKASSMKGVEAVAIDAHIGSQIFDLRSFSDSVEKLISLAKELHSNGIEIKYIDIGGGLGIAYKEEEKPPSPYQYAEVLRKHLAQTPYKFILEPGRSLVGNSGVMLTKVLYNKQGTEKKFVIVDAAMNDLIRPSLYSAYHKIIPTKKKNTPPEKVDVVGPICESGDFLATERMLPQVSRGDYLAVLSAGAYGFVMASNYNSRPKPAEVIVNGKEFHTIRKRENFEDLIRGETIPDFLK